MSATIYSGAESGTIPAGTTVDQARTTFRTLYGIPDTANPLVNNRAVTGGYVLQDDDELSFSKPVGEKG